MARREPDSQTPALRLAEPGECDRYHLSETAEPGWYTQQRTLTTLLQEHVAYDRQSHRRLDRRLRRLEPMVTSAGKAGRKTSIGVALMALLTALAPELIKLIQ